MKHGRLARGLPDATVRSFAHEVALHHEHSLICGASICPAVCTGGHLKPDVYSRVGNLANEYGVEAAAEVAAFEMEHVLAVQALVEKEKIDCDMEVNRVCDVHFDPAQLAKVKAGYDSLVAKGVKTVEDVKFTGLEAAEAVSLSQSYVPYVCTCLDPPTLADIGR